MIIPGTQTIRVPLIVLLLSACSSLAQILDFVEAKQRADGGDAFAQAVVALHYQLGWKTAKNPELAVKYALASANAGHPLGQFRLGALLRAGEGVPKDEQQGLAYQAASAKGLNKSHDPYSVTSLAILLFQGKAVAQGVSKEERQREAARLYKLAADAGYAPAQFNYAMCAEAGHGMPKDQAIRTEYLKLASAQGYAIATQALAESGEGDPPIEAGAASSGTVVATGGGVGTSNHQPDSPEVADLENEVNALYEELSSGATGLIKEAMQIDQSKWKRDLDSSLDDLGPYADEQARLSHRKSVLEERVRLLKENLLIAKRRGDSIANSEPSAQLQIWPVLESIVGIAAGGPWTVVHDKAGAVFIFDNASKMLVDRVLLPDVYGWEASTIVVDPVEREVVLRLTWPPYHDAWTTLLIDSSSVFTSGQPLFSRGVRIVPDNAGRNDESLSLWRLDESSWPRDLPYSDVFSDPTARSSAARLEPAAFAPMIRDPNFSSEEFIKTAAADHWIFQKKDRENYSWLRSFELLNEAEFLVTSKDSNSEESTLERWNLVEFRRETISPDTTLDLKSVPVESLSDGSAKTLQQHKVSKDWQVQFAEATGGLRPDELGFERPMLAFPRTGRQFVVGFDGPGVTFNNCYEIASLGLVFWDSCEVIGGADNRGLAPKVLWDLRTGKAVASRDLDEGETSEKSLPVTQFRASARPSIGRAGSADGFLIYSDISKDGRRHVITHYDWPSMDIRKTWEGIESGGCPSLSSDGKSLYAISPDAGAIDWYAAETGEREGSIYQLDGGGLAIVLADGFYAASGMSADTLGCSVAGRAYPFEQFDLRLNRPDIVLERLGAPSEAVAIAKQLREKRLKRMGVTEEMLKPDFHVPEVEIVSDVPSTTDSDEIDVVIKASDSKYPLERLRVFVNNVPANGRDGELLREEAKSDDGLLGRITGAFSEAATGPQNLERTIPIKLAAGRNKIQVSVLNNAGAESLYANAEVNCIAQRPKPTLYAVALGVSDYANPEWNLQYAAKDAEDVLERLKSQSSGSYGEVKELLLTDKQVTKGSLAQIKSFLKDATIDDTVLMFVAGHGLLDSKYDYYFGTTDIDFNNPAEKGIAFEEFDDLLAGLPSLKKSLLIDTCHAGELDEEEKTLIASAGGVAAPLPTGSGIAIRSIGTRGMNVKAVEGARGASEWYDRLQGLFVDLRRGSGSTILSSSAGAEYALESSEQQNGLFTYAVLEALDGNKDADINKDGSVQMSELGEYVKKRVSELTNNKQTPNTRRVNLEGDFTVAETK
jgi:hypothetical protein